MTFIFWQRWLLISSIFFTIVGVVTALFSDSFIFDGYNQEIAALFWGQADIPEGVLSFKKFIFGPLGMTIAGKWILMIYIAACPFKEKERWAFEASWAGLLSWFTIDSAVSIYYGADFNIYRVNIFPLIFIGLPLLMTRRYFILPKAGSEENEGAVSFWQSWLFAVSLLFIGMGLLTSFMSTSFIFRPYNILLAQTFWETNTIPKEFLDFKGFIFGPLGGTLVGYMVLMAYIVKFPFRKGKKEAYWAIVVALLTWFLVDTMISLYHEAYFNIAMANLPTLFLIGIPLLITKKSF